MEGLLDRKPLRHNFLDNPWICEDWAKIERNTLKFGRPPFPVKIPKERRQSKHIKVDASLRADIDLRYMVTIEQASSSPETTEFHLVMSRKKTYRQKDYPLRTSKDRQLQEEQELKAREHSVSSLNDEEMTRDRFAGVGGVIAPYRIECRAASIKEKMGWLRALKPFDKMQANPVKCLPFNANETTSTVALKSGLIPYKKMPRLSNGEFNHEKIFLLLSERVAHTPYFETHVDALHTCMMHVETHGLRNRYILKEDYLKKDVSRLIRHLFVVDTRHIPPQFDLATIGGTIKELLGRLPESVLTKHLECTFLEMAEMGNQDAINSLFLLLPPVHKEIIQRLMLLCRHIDYNAKETRMTLDKLALELGPFLLQHNSSNNHDFRSRPNLMVEQIEELYVPLFEAISRTNFDTTFEEQGLHAGIAPSGNALGPIMPVPDETELEFKQRVVEVSERVIDANWEVKKRKEKQLGNVVPTRIEDRQPPSSADEDPMTNMYYSMFSSIAGPKPVIEKPVATWGGQDVVAIGPSKETLAQQSRHVARPEVPAPRFEPFEGAARFLPFGQYVGLCGVEEEPHPPAVEHFNDGFHEDVDIEASLEAGAQYKAEVRKIQRHHAGSSRNPVKNQRNQPYTTRFAYKVSSSALVSPVLAAPAMFVLQAGANMGLISSNFETDQSVIPIDKPLAQIRNCLGPHIPLSIAKPMHKLVAESAVRPEPEAAKAYGGPSIGLAQAQLDWEAIVALRKHIASAEKAFEELHLQVSSDRYRAEWEDIQIYQKKNRVSNKAKKNAAAKRRSKRRRNKGRSSRNHSRINSANTSGNVSPRSMSQAGVVLPVTTVEEEEEEEDLVRGEFGLQGGMLKRIDSVHGLMAAEESDESSGGDLPLTYKDEDNDGFDYGTDRNDHVLHNIRNMPDEQLNYMSSPESQYWQIHTLKEALRKKKKVDKLLRKMETSQETQLRIMCQRQHELEKKREMEAVEERQQLSGKRWQEDGAQDFIDEDEADELEDLLELGLREDDQVVQEVVRMRTVRSSVDIVSDMSVSSDDDTNSNNDTNDQQNKGYKHVQSPKQPSRSFKGSELDSYRDLQDDEDLSESEDGMGLAELQKEAHMLEKFILARRQEHEELERERQLRSTQRQLAKVGKLADQKRQELLQIKKEAEARAWRATAPRWDANIFWTDVGEHPLRRAYEKNSARLAAARAELFDLRRQLKRLYVSVKELMANQGEHPWPVMVASTFGDPSEYTKHQRLPSRKPRKDVVVGGDHSEDKEEDVDDDGFVVVETTGERLHEEPQFLSSEDEDQDPPMQEEHSFASDK